MKKFYAIPINSPACRTFITLAIANDIGDDGRSGISINQPVVDITAIDSMPGQFGIVLDVSEHSAPSVKDLLLKIAASINGFVFYCAKRGIFSVDLFTPALQQGVSLIPPFKDTQVFPLGVAIEEMLHHAALAAEAAKDPVVVDTTREDKDTLYRLRLNDIKSKAAAKKQDWIDKLNECIANLDTETSEKIRQLDVEFGRRPR